jgi:hypothetical protein
MQPVGLVEPRLELLLDRQGDLQGQWRDGLEQHAPDRVIETAARNALTNRFGLRDPSTLTDVRGPCGPLAAVIAHRHPIPTDPAHREPLQERGPLAWGTPASVGPIRLRVLAQPALILFKVLPRDVTDMRIRDQGRPLLARQPLGHEPRLGGVTLPAAPEKERARIAWIVKDPEHARMLQPAPQRLALVGAGACPTGKRELLIAERFHGRTGGAGPPKCLEERAEGLLDLPIRIETDSTGGVVHEAHGQGDFELAAAGLIHDAAAEPRPQHMELRFAHRALQAEEQPIIEMRGIIEAVLIQDQRLRQRTDFEQPMPVHGVARQA